MKLNDVFKVFDMDEDCVVTISEIFHEPAYEGSINEIPSEYLNRGVRNAVCKKITSWHDIAKLDITLDWGESE